MRERLLARFPLFDQLPAQRLDRLLASAPLQRAGAGSVLFEPGRPCTAFPLVLDGSVRVFVSRLLRQFEERGWVRLERERVSVLEPKALLEFANS